MKKKEIKDRVKSFLADGYTFKKMSQIYKKIWLENLRSGKFKQVSDALCKIEFGGTQKSYCCLGVLCETVAEKQIKDHKKRINVELTHDKTGFKFNGQEDLLHNSIAEVVIIDDVVQEFLASLNDRGASFKQIADVIEEYM